MRVYVVHVQVCVRLCLILHSSVKRSEEGQKPVFLTCVLVMQSFLRCGHGSLPNKAAYPKLGKCKDAYMHADANGIPVQYRS